MRNLILIIIFSILSAVVAHTDHEDYKPILDQKLDKLFFKYTNNQTEMSNEQLKSFLNHFVQIVINKTDNEHTDHDHHHDHDHDHHHDHDHDHSHQTKPNQNTECLSKKLDEIYNYIKSTNPNRPYIDKQKFNAVQNWIVYEIDFCLSSSSNHTENAQETTKTKNWIFAFVSGLVISVVGILCYLVVPSSDSSQFKNFFQFLVSLAVGSLAGDSLIHLIPHAFSEHDHDHGHDDHGDHLKGVWKGLSAVVGIYVFFAIEKIMMIRRARKEKRHRKLELNEQAEIIVNSNSISNESTLQNRDPSFYLVHGNKELKYISQYLPNNPCPTNVHHHDCEHETEHLHMHNTDAISSVASISRCDTEAKLIQDIQPEFLPKHSHGHSHKNHIYKSYREKAHHDHHLKHEKEVNDIKLIAWMVIMGDGLHNFADGLAIGMSFVTSLTAGFATSVAVLCHELPHEIGDFAVLRRAGVSLKRAIFFNAISGILCMFGVLVGLLINEFVELKSWSFLFIAGTFLYISLVDMIPELSEDKEDDSIINFLIQSFGILFGVGTMLAIAVLEEYINKLFQF